MRKGTRLRHAPPTYGSTALRSRRCCLWLAKQTRRVRNLYVFKYKIRARPRKWLRAPCLFYLLVAKANTKKPKRARRNKPFCLRCGSLEAVSLALKGGIMSKNLSRSRKPEQSVDLCFASKRTNNCVLGRRKPVF